MRLFDAIHHKYYIDGEEVPSVTQVINAVYPRYPVDPYYLEKGQILHTCCSWLATGGEVDDVDPVIAGRVSACRRFLKETGFRAVEVEVKHFDAVHMVAGTFDAIGPFNGFDLILDWKSSVSKNDGLQLDGYCLLTGIKKGLIVELHDDGTYTMGKVKMLNANRFLRVLKTYRKMEEERIK